MVLELHIWGPAFSLPSIDAQCLATIAYFVQAVPRDAWVLVASSDPSVSPTNELPALKNGLTWVSKFRNIVDYLRQYSNGEWDLDAHWNRQERADNIAFSAFTESNARTLIDLSLYVASQNYYSGTAPAYGAILTWPNQWIIPPKLRSAAKTRTEHLGLSSLDLEAMEEQRDRERSAAVAAGQIPKSLILRPRETVSSLLGKTAQRNQFKLGALTAELFEPLQEMLSNKEYFLSDERCSSLDAIVLGYLSLVLVPELPSHWLRDALKTKTPRLAQYVERMQHKCFGVVQVSDAFTETNTSLLPWRPPERVTAAKIGNTLLNTLADATPILKDLRMNDRLREAALSSDAELNPTEQKAISEYSLAQKRDTYLSLAMVTAGISALLAYAAYVGLVPVGGNREEEKEKETLV